MEGKNGTTQQILGTSIDPFTLILLRARGPWGTFTYKVTGVLHLILNFKGTSSPWQIISNKDYSD